MRHLLMTICGLGLIGCSSQQSTVDKQQEHSDSFAPFTLVLQCEGNFSFVARSDNGNQLWAFFDNDTIMLEQVRVASGVKYQAKQDFVWLKGDDAMVHYQGTHYTACKNNRQQAIWQDAKFRGVSFRAIGNEPGWQIEIQDEQAITYLGSYGQQRVIFPYTTPIREPNGARFNTQKHNQSLTLELDDTPCQDSMSGEQFTVTVRGYFNSQPFKGCGRALF